MSGVRLTLLYALCLAMLALAVALAVENASGAPASSSRTEAGRHWPGCRTAACDRRVGKRIRERRRERWCRRHESCLFRERFHALSASWQGWAWRTAGCETGQSYDFTLDTGNGFYGGLQFALGTWQKAGGSGWPHHATKWEQLWRAARYAMRGHTGEWPVCG